MYNEYKFRVAMEKYIAKAESQYKTHRKVANNTVVFLQDGVLCFQLHNTVIFTVDTNRNSGVHVFFGEWNTVTTRQRVNKFLEEFGFNDRFTQRNHRLCLNGQEVTTPDEVFSLR